MNAITITGKSAVQAVKIGGHDEFHEGRVAYEAAAAAYVAIEADQRRRVDAAAAESPIPEALRDRDNTGFLLSEKCIEHARFMTFGQKADLLPILAAWKAKRAEAEARHGVDWVDDESDPADIAHNARYDAALRFLAIPAPDPSGLVLQLRAAINVGHLDEKDEDADDELTISRLITPTETCFNDGRAMAMVYRSALRAAGVSSPALDAEPFDPDAWVIAFEEAHPGVEMTNQGVAWIEAPDGSLAPREPASSAYQSLRPWQKAMVRKVAYECGDNAVDWLNDFEDAGGNICIDPEGAVCFGGSVDAGEALDRRNELLADLKSSPLLGRRVIAKAPVHFAAVGLRNMVESKPRAHTEPVV